MHCASYVGISPLGPMPSGKEDDKAEPEMKPDNIISENQQKATELLHPQGDEGSLAMITVPLKGNVALIARRALALDSSLQACN